MHFRTYVPHYYRLLEAKVVPLYFARDGEGTPQAWLRVAKEAIRTGLTQFSARRMLREYVEAMYGPAAREAAGARAG